MKFSKADLTKSPERLAIEGALKNATSAGTCLSNEEIAEATFVPLDKVRKITANLKQDGHLATTRRANGRHCSRYVWAALAKSQPNLVLVDDPTPVIHEKPLRNGTTSGTWTAPKWEIARPEGNDHMKFGSLRGDTVVPHAPPISMCVGKGVERFMPERLQR